MMSIIIHPVHLRRHSKPERTVYRTRHVKRARRCSNRAIPYRSRYRSGSSSSGSGNAPAAVMMLRQRRWRRPPRLRRDPPRPTTVRIQLATGARRKNLKVFLEVKEAASSQSRRRPEMGVVVASRRHLGTHWRRRVGAAAPEEVAMATTRALLSYLG